MTFTSNFCPFFSPLLTSALYPHPYQLVPPSFLSNCHPVIFLQEGAAQTLMKGSSISVRPSSALASFATAPLGLLKWLKFNVQNEGSVWKDGEGKLCIFKQES